MVWNEVIALVVGLVVAKMLAEWALTAMNLGHLRKVAAQGRPEALAETVDEETFRKSVAYTQAHGRLGMIETAVTGITLLALFATGLLPWLWEGLTALGGGGIWVQAIAILAIMMLLSVPTLPIELYDQFVLEEKFGFNKSTLGIWISDKIKGLIVSVIIGIPIFVVILWIARTVPLWWLWAALVVMAFQLVMMIVYPMFIMPLFNKFEPLGEGGLKDRLFALSERVRFPVKNILVMDGSKRSAHANAFFTGFGNVRRVVLYDTLVEQIGEQELEAVLAHEIGHYKLGHIPKLLAVSLLGTIAMFAIVGYLANHSDFLGWFGFAPEAGIAAVLLVVLLVSGLVGFWLGPLMNVLSRKHEYEADAFAREALHTGTPLIGALRKLHEKNLSNMVPHPVYSTFFYSHPTLLERERALADPS